jgi:AcrR family transcriptional regulator
LQQTYNPVIDTQSVREDFIAMSKNAFQSWSGPSARELAINMLAVMVNHPNVYQAFYDQIIAPRFQQFKQMITLAQARGDIRQDISADEIIGLLAGPLWYHLFFSAESIPLVPGLPERLVDALLQGIAMPRKSSGE